MSLLTLTKKLKFERVWNAFFTPKMANANGHNGTAKLNSGRSEAVPFGEIELAVTVWGHGPAILLLHGWGGDRSQMRRVGKALAAAGYQAVAFDLPAHGDSPGQQTTLFEGRAAILTIEERYGPFEAVVAHSFGTLTNTMALAAGLQTKKVVHFGAFRSGRDAVERFFKMIPLPQILLFPMKTRFRAKMEETFGKDLWEVTSAPRLAAQLDIPALFIHDQEDDVTPFSDSEAISAAWPGAKLHATSGLGHRGALKDPAVIEMVVGFIQGE